MTEMKRTTVSLPDEMVARLDKMKQHDEYKNCTYSELIRRMVTSGLEREESRESA